MRQLNLAEQALHKDKSWILAQAVREFLTRREIRPLAEETLRQSILVSQGNYDETWEENTDADHWRS
jgi:hypothetical protein